MRLPTAGFVVGVGLGGFLDGILFHQIAQWHNMGSAVLAPTTMGAMSLNMRWDGFFHAGTWLVTLVGIWMLWFDQRRSAPRPQTLVGQMLLGWGVFNLVEGVVDHHLLELHHVRDMPVHVPAYDWIFLVIGGLLPAAVGWKLARGSPGAVTPP